MSEPNINFYSRSFPSHLFRPPHVRNFVNHRNNQRLCCRVTLCLFKCSQVHSIPHHPRADYYSSVSLSIKLLYCWLIYFKIDLHFQTHWNLYYNERLSVIKTLGKSINWSFAPVCNSVHPKQLNAWTSTRDSSFSRPHMTVGDDSRQREYKSEELVGREGIME